MREITLYGKPGCHLCDDARAVVAGLRDELAFDLREVDVSADPRLNAAYGERIPVLEVDGEEVAQFFVDPGALRERLGRVDL